MTAKVIAVYLPALAATRWYDDPARLPRTTKVVPQAIPPMAFQSRNLR